MYYILFCRRGHVIRHALAKHPKKENLKDKEENIQEQENIEEQEYFGRF